MCATPSPANLIYTVSYKDILGRFLVAQKESPRMLSTVAWSVAEALLEETPKLPQVQHFLSMSQSVAPFLSTVSLIVLCTTAFAYISCCS
jgi:hypothetical protein